MATRVGGRLIGAIAALVMAGGLAEAPPSRAQTGVDVLSFTPRADTYVDASQPGLSFPTATAVKVDGTPVKQAFFRFSVTGIDGRDVTAVRLRLFQKDSARLGGRVFGVASNAWSETMTWADRPAIDGPQVGAFGTVTAGRWYEADLADAVTTDGTYSFALDSTSSDGSYWATRHTTTPPQLVVEVERTGAVVDGLSEVATQFEGSGQPTYFASNHRVAVTEGGRLLTIFGRHASGIQLAWRDGGSGWRRTTTGRVSDGQLLSGMGTGDFSASMALGRDVAGRQHAWVVWAGPYYNSGRPLQLVRLSDLDSSAGPTVGPVVTVDAGSLGVYKPDIAFERGADGLLRGFILYSRKMNSDSYELVVRSFTDLDVADPAVGSETVLYASTSSSRFGTLVETNQGTKAVVRASSGALRMYSHAVASSPSQWTRGLAGPVVGSASVPGATALASGDVLAAVESDTQAHVVKVVRFAAGGGISTELQTSGYMQPAITGDGTSAWLVMMRASDGAVVSRRLTGTSWGSDRVEIGPEGGGNHAWPNLSRAVDGRLRLVVRGPAGTSNRSAVLAYQREV